MTPAVFEPAVPASERSQIHALDRAATGIGFCRNICSNKIPAVTGSKIIIQPDPNVVEIFKALYGLIRIPNLCHEF